MFLDTALREREASGKPIRVGMIGAGATGRAIALQLGTPAPGIRLAGIANRTLSHGERAFREAGVTAWSQVGSAREADAKIAKGLPVLTDERFAAVREQFWRRSPWFRPYDGLSGQWQSGNGREHSSPIPHPEVFDYTE